ncbi:MAG: DUF1697 domain-containing protein [Thermoplasmata archaeon]
MTVYIVLLRAVNLGGSTQLSMAALGQLMSRQGLEDVRTVLQSGNVVFRTPETDTARLERALESALSEILGHGTEVFVRSSLEWQAVLKQNPFPREAERDPAQTVVTVLKRAPTTAEWDALRGAIRGRERVEGSGRQAYILYPDGIGRSKLTAAVIERHLATRGTSRNWNTVRKLDQMAAS